MVNNRLKAIKDTCKEKKNKEEGRRNEVLGVKDKTAND
jgi:hypothetical protein